MGRVDRVMGVDACKAGWIGVVLEDLAVVAVFGRTIAELAEKAGPVDITAVDMPIGLPDDTTREADRLTRNLVGSSVFATPTRAALAEADHAAATEVNRRVAGAGVSIQAHSLRVKLLEVDRWVRTTAPGEVVDAHPEVSFLHLAGERLVAGKKTWAGATARRAALARAGVEVPDELGEAGGQAGVDDVLDVAVLAWTARRVRAGEAITYPDPPQVFSDGLPAAIWA